MNPFRVAVLASGSSGNSTLVKAGRHCFLIDVGISLRELNKRLGKINVSLDKIEGIFLTHEHIDHIRGLETLSKKTTIPIYTSSKTWQAISLTCKNMVMDNCRVIEKNVVVDDVTITSFPVSHDAVDPHGYAIETEGAKCTYATDLGFVSPAVRVAVEGCSTLILESNHDIEMLENGPYPERLKRRILSTKGHLSNFAAGNVLAGMKSMPNSVVLAHLSRHNNRPELALRTIGNLLNEPSCKIKILVASQDEVVADFDTEEVEL